MKNAFLLILCLSLVACAQRMDDDNAGDDDVVTPNPDPDPTPDPTPDPECVTDLDCTTDVACANAVCDGGTCTDEPACDDEEVCNEDLDECEPEVVALPTVHDLRCFVNNGTLYVTVSGKLTDANYGGNLVDPTHVSLASNAIDGSWNTTTLSTTYVIALSSQETALGGLVSGTIAVPEELARRFTLLIWPASGQAQRFDLSSWNVSGETCARIGDGSESGGSSDGHIVGRAPLCPSACDDGNASTDDVCTTDGCTHSGAPATPGTISCAHVGSGTHVTVGPGILAHLVNGAMPTPGTGWKVRFGYGGIEDTAWISDAASHVLKTSKNVVGFNLTLRAPDGTEYWFDLSEYDVAGTCALNAQETEVVHTPPPAIVGTIQCQRKLVNGVEKREFAITPNSGRDIQNGLNENIAALPSPSAIQYGSQTDGWTLPYQTGSNKPQAVWSGGTATYYLYLDLAVDDLNFFVVDNDDQADQVAGGDYVDIGAWDITNVGSAGCTKIPGGGISTN